MKTMKPTLLVLAAGMGSRYGGLKQLDQLGPSGETIIDYSVFDAIRAGFGKMVFVIRRDIENEFKESIIRKYEDKIPVEYVFQELSMVPEGIKVPEERVKPWGTGHAVLVAKEVIHEPFAVINADDFYGKDSFRVMADFLSALTPEQQDRYCMVGYELQYTLSEFGSVSRGACEANERNELQKMVERTKIERKDGKICYEEEGKWITLKDSQIVSMNLFGFAPSFFSYLQTQFKTFIKENSDNPKAEFYIPLVVNNLIHSGKVTMNILPTRSRWFGVTYKEDKQVAENKIRELVAMGEYPDNLWKP